MLQAEASVSQSETPVAAAMLASRERQEIYRNIPHFRSLQANPRLSTITPAKSDTRVEMKIAEIEKHWLDPMSETKPPLKLAKCTLFGMIFIPQRASWDLLFV